MSAGTIPPPSSPFNPPRPEPVYAPAPPQSLFRLWTVDEYHRMIDAGILGEDERVELIEGWILHMFDRAWPPDAVQLWPGWPPPRKFTVDEYHRMIRAGILKEGEAVELLEGWVIRKMPRNTPHEVASDKTEDAVRAALPPGWRMRVQKAISTGDSEPEPDCAVVEGGPDKYLASHPTPADIAFVVEVSDSTLDLDRTSKGRTYGRAGITIYWIVNIPDRQIEVFTGPSGPVATPGYETTRVYREDETVPVVIRGQEVGAVRVADCLPRV
jgi:Uma2 family endonuclease